MNVTNRIDPAEARSPYLHLGQDLPFYVRHIGLRLRSMGDSNGRQVYECTTNKVKLQLYNPSLSA